MNLAEKLAAQKAAEDEDKNVTTTIGGVDGQGDDTASLQAKIAEKAKALESAEPELSGIFSCHPVANLRVGPHQFERGKLDYSNDPESAEKLRKLIASMPPHEASKIRETSLNAVDRLVKAHQELTGSNVDRTGDSGSARAAMQNLQARFPKVGSQPIDVPNRTNGG